MARVPAAISLCCSQLGEGAILMFSKTLPIYIGQALGSLSEIFRLSGLLVAPDSGSAVGSFSGLPVMG